MIYALVRQATEPVNLFLLGLYATKGTSRYMGLGTPSHSNPRFIAVSSMRTLVGRPPPPLNRRPTFESYDPREPNP